MQILIVSENDATPPSWDGNGIILLTCLYGVDILHRSRM